MSSADFEPERYKDDYRERAEAMIDEKAKGQEIKPAPRVKPRGQVVDIFAALKESLETAKTKRTAEPAKRKRKA